MSSNTGNIKLPSLTPLFKIPVPEKTSDLTNAQATIMETVQASKGKPFKLAKKPKSKSPVSANAPKAIEKEKPNTFLQNTTKSERDLIEELVKADLEAILERDAVSLLPNWDLTPNPSRKPSKKITDGVQKKKKSEKSKLHVPQKKKASIMKTVEASNVKIFKLPQKPKSKSPVFANASKVIANASKVIEKEKPNTILQNTTKSKRDLNEELVKADSEAILERDAVSKSNLSRKPSKKIADDVQKKKKSEKSKLHVPQTKKASITETVEASKVKIFKLAKNPKSKSPVFANAPKVIIANAPKAIANAPKAIEKKKPNTALQNTTKSKDLVEELVKPDLEANLERDAVSLLPSSELTPLSRKPSKKLSDDVQKKKISEKSKLHVPQKKKSSKEEVAKADKTNVSVVASKQKVVVADKSKIEIPIQSKGL